MKQRLKALIGTAVDRVYSKPALKNLAKAGKRLAPEFLRNRISQFSEGRRLAFLHSRRRALALMQTRYEVPERTEWILRALDRTDNNV